MVFVKAACGVTTNASECGNNDHLDRNQWQRFCGILPDSVVDCLLLRRLLRRQIWTLLLQPHPFLPVGGQGLNQGTEIRIFGVSAWAQTLASKRGRMLGLMLDEGADSAGSRCKHFTFGPLHFAILALWLNVQRISFSSFLRTSLSIPLHHTPLVSSCNSVSSPCSLRSPLLSQPSLLAIFLNPFRVKLKSTNIWMTSMAMAAECWVHISSPWLLVTNPNW